MVRADVGNVHLIWISRPGTRFRTTRPISGGQVGGPSARTDIMPISLLQAGFRLKLGQDGKTRSLAPKAAFCFGHARARN